MADLGYPLIPSRLRSTPTGSPMQLDFGTVGGAMPQGQSIFDRIAAANLARAIRTGAGTGKARQRINPAMAQSMVAPAAPSAPSAPPAQPSAPPAQPGFFDGLPAFDSPAGRGLGAAASTLLQASGYSPTPITLGQALGAAGQAGMEAYTAAQAAEQKSLLDQAELVLKAQKQSGPFAGQSIGAQDRNVLLKIAPKIKAGTATESEKAIYNLSYANMAKPRIQTSYDETGREIRTEIPGVEMPESVFPRPEGFKDPFQTEKPGAEEIKLAYKQRDSLSMLQNLNKYRRTITNPEFVVSEQIAGAMGFPSALASKAQAQATALRLELKSLYELGALVGGDFQILDSLLTSPTTVEAIKGGKDFLLAQLDELESQLEIDMAKRDVQLQGTLAMPIVANSEEQWKAAPNYTHVQLPNGKVVYKSPARRK